MIEYLCPLTDLPVDQCGCDQHHRTETTVITIAALERLAGRPLPEFRVRHRNPEWQVPEPKRTTCEHRDDDLCGDCTTLLDGLLTDLPDLMEQLGIAMRKSVRFAPRGHRKGDQEHPDESPIPWNPSAAHALHDLERIVHTGRNLDRHQLLTELSTAMSRGHRVIDRPKDRLYTRCPLCKTDIWLDETGSVYCPDTVCGYTAPTWQRHQTDLLDANADAMLTATDLVVALATSDTEAKSIRNRIDYAVRHKGLPREQINRPNWDNGRVVTEAQWIYRVRDIRDMALNRRKATA